MAAFEPTIGVSNMPDNHDERREDIGNRTNGNGRDRPALPIDDDEVVYRHIPGGVQFQNPPDKPITSENFRLRPGESGVSASRSGLTTPAAILKRLGDPTKGSRIAACRVGDVRALGFAVVPDPLDDDPGHVLILSGDYDLSARIPRKRLANLFQLLDLPDRVAEGAE